MKKRKLLSAVGIVILVAFVAGLNAIGWFSRSTQTDQNLFSGQINGEYIGREGVVLQTRTNECGPCALKMIFDHYLIPSSLSEIEKGTAMTEQGTSMLSLKKFAELKGLKAEGWRFTPEDFMHSSFPSILYVNNDHFIVADSLSHDIIFVRDPAMGRFEIAEDNLCKIWKGETLVFSKP